GLADDEGGLDVVAPRELAELLRPHAATLRLVVVQACQSGNTGGLESHAGSVAQAIHRAGIPVVLASRYPLSVAGSVRITERFYRSLLVDLRSTEAATLAARQDEVAIPGSFDWAALQLYADPEVGLESRPIAFRPFRGLLPFESRHARFFFGRDDDVAALVDRLGARLREGGPRLLLVAGASGSGKSSLVHAGLLPALANSALPELPHDPATDLVLFRPGERPDDPLSLLRERLARAAEAGSDRAVVVVIDQLEELFTEVDEPARTSLTRALWGLATEGHDVVVATVRIEFIGRFGEVPMDDEGRKFDAVALDERFRYFVRQLAPEQVDAIIHGPARAVGLRFEDGLVARLRADVGREPGALPLLSYTLDLLWQHRRGRWLKDQTYDALGRLVGALTTTADDLYASLGAPARQAQAERLLVQLVHMAEDPAMATRRRGHLDRLRPAAAAEGAHFDAAVDALVDARLLVRGCSSDERRGLDRAWIEIAHEALIRGWTRLQTWLRESREWLDYTDDLRAYAEAWSPHQGGTRETDYLLTGTRLAYAAEMWSRHGARLGAGDQRLLGAFVERCTERERARLRGRRAIIGAVFTAISIAAVIAI
ncbi:MAG: CHAT domain-containing protein, partial [Myxococcales bacterium]|nr:CHAT domain-containing protein [Myxococcales bacterium]